MSKAIVLLLLCTLAAIAQARRDGDFLSMSRTRRMPGGGMVRMRGYVGLSRKGGYPMAYAGGFAGARSEHDPSYAFPGSSAEEEPIEDPVPERREEPQEDEEADPEPAPFAKPQRPSRARPVRPSKPARPVKPSVSAEEDDFGGPPPTMGGRGGATAIATAYSNGKGATAKSHAIAYDGNFSGGRFKHRYGGHQSPPFE